MRPRRRPLEQTRPVNRDTTRINESIRVPRVRLIDSDGAQLGIKSTDEAREYAYAGASVTNPAAEPITDTAERFGWTVISMRDDWSRVFA